MTSSDLSRFDVFISYSTSDQSWVREQLVPQLEAAGLRVGVDYRDFALGVPTMVNAEQMIARSRYTVVVLSPAWVATQAADFESLIASSHDPNGQQRRLIPLLLAPCELPARIAMLTAVDFSNPATQVEAFERLIQGLGATAQDQPQIRRRVFLSYKRSVEPDHSLALQIFQALRAEHDVYIDQVMLVGTPWAEQLESEIRRADAIIVLLSQHAVHSEMVEAEISQAHHIAKVKGGRPQLLPVRVAYQDPFQYPLSAYLNHINWAAWSQPSDTPGLIEELRRALGGGSLTHGQPLNKADLLTTEALPQPLPAAQPKPLEQPEGTMDPQSAFYVERPADRIALGAIQRQGVTITIKGPRQMGKSSLLTRTIVAAIEGGKQVAFLDFQLFDRSALENADLFFRQFCLWLTSELDLPDRVDEYWAMPLGNAQRCTRYVGRYLLPELGKPLVLAMDEVESIFETSFRSDFFGMLRSWHNNRSTSPIWKQLDLALVTSTEPYQLIDNLNQSPFNVGEVLDLVDLTLEQVNDLNQRHAQPLSAAQVSQLMALLGGHPYLVRRAFYLVASGRVSATELFATASQDQGPFGDHLRYHLFRLHDKPDLIAGLRQVIRQQSSPDERIFFRLRGAGLVRRDGRAVLPRCQLYADYFAEHLP